jgi:tRNA dimethylallyltransferase
LIDVAEPDQVWSPAIFQQAAWQAIDKVHAHRRLPFLVGAPGNTSARLSKDGVSQR